MALSSPKTRSPRSIPAAAELLLGATGHRSLLPRGGTSSPQPLALPCAQGRHHPPEGCSQPWLPALRPFGKQGGEGGASFAWEKGARQRDPGAPTPCQKCLVLISSSAVVALRGALLLVPWLGAALSPASLHLSLSGAGATRRGYGGPGCAHGVHSASTPWKEPSTRAAFFCSPPSGFAWQWGDREATCPVLCVSLFLQASLPNSLLIPARAAPLSAALRCSPSMQGRKCQQGNDSAIVQRLKYGNPV